MEKLFVIVLLAVSSVYALTREQNLKDIRDDIDAFLKKRSFDDIERPTGIWGRSIDDAFNGENEIMIQSKRGKKIRNQPAPPGLWGKRGEIEILRKKEKGLKKSLINKQTN